MQSCTIIDFIVYYMFTKREGRNELSEAVQRFLREQPQALRRILLLLFQLVITGEMSSTWGMARPLLGLILMYQDDFRQIQEQITKQQIPDRRAKVSLHFADLMSGVEENLTAKNKVRFLKKHEFEFFEM